MSAAGFPLPGLVLTFLGCLSAPGGGEGLGGGDGVLAAAPPVVARIGTYQLCYETHRGSFSRRMTKCRTCKHEVLMRGDSHDYCRTHAPCAKGYLYNSTNCEICEELWQASRDLDNPEATAAAFSQLYHWIRGFVKNTKYRPKGSTIFDDPDEEQDFNELSALWSRRRSKAAPSAAAAAPAPAATSNADSRQDVTVPPGQEEALEKTGSQESLFILTGIEPTQPAQSQPHESEEAPPPTHTVMSEVFTLYQRDPDQDAVHEEESSGSSSDDSSSDSPGPEDSEEASSLDPRPSPPSKVSAKVSVCLSFLYVFDVNVLYIF